MKTFLTLLFLFFLFSSRATNYYFSALSGNDSRSSAQATNPSTPWETIDKLNRYFSNLKPGDSVLFKRGEVFYGAIKVNKSGKAGSPLVIGAYGIGDQPVITSLVTLDNWVSKGNGIWESRNSSLGWTVSTLLLNNEAQQIGRYPNLNAANKGYLILESHFRTYFFTDNELTSATNWKGAEVVIRMRRWVLDRNRVKSHTGNKVTYVATSAYKPKDNYGYFFQNDIRTLDQFGEWCYNRQTKTISVYFGKQAPSSYSIQATTIENLISSSGMSNVTFDNLNVKGANSDGVTIKNGSGVKIMNCNIGFSGRNGVTVNGYSNLKIENCRIYNSNNNGIDLGSRGNNGIIRNNKIINTSVFAGMGASGDSKGIAILSNGNGNIIEYNEIRNTGYIAIRFGGDYVTIKNNFIDSFCTTKDDGSGIYTFTGHSNAARKGRKIIGNIIMDGIGVPEGINNTSKPLAEGIYLDDNASGVEIIGNTVANITSKGIFLHNARKVTIADNTLFNNQVQLSLMHDKKGDPVRNCVITKNTFFSKSPSQGALAFYSIKKDKHLIGRFEDNDYARPLDKNSPSYLARVKSYDARAAVTNFDEPVRFVYNPSSVSKTIALDGNYADVKNNKYSNKIVLQPFTSAVLIEYRGSVKNTAPKVSIISPEVNATYKGPATIRIIAKASDDGSIEKVQFYNGTTLLRTESYSPYTHSWLNVPPGKYSITAKATDNSGNVTTSEAVSISVTSSSSEGGKNNSAPQVKITHPVKNANYKSGASINISATASDKDGLIKKVEFYEGTTLLHTETGTPFSWDWNNADPGNYTIIAKATDNSGSTTKSEPVSISVISSLGGGNNTSPEVKITSPVKKSNYKSGAIINISAVANDADGSIKKVEFYKGTTLLHTETGGPYTWDWNDVPAGKYTIIAKATDNSGNVTTSKGVTVSVTSSSSSGENGTGPKVKITSPTVNQKYKAAANIFIKVDASDANGSIKKVEFYNGTVLLHTALRSPYNYSWRRVPAGNYTIIAKATDNSGNETTSESVTVSVAAKHAHRGVSKNNDTSANFSNVYTFNLNRLPVSKAGTQIFNLKVFPNPAVNKIRINIDGLLPVNRKTTLNLQSLSGIILKSTPVFVPGKTIEADISSLAAGVYIVSIVCEDFIVSSKFVKN